jgi:2-dehydro-3-deoxyphosphogluconate aldolase/(4S)-4-hydroxy-2-oxoglutarate aldolase
MDTLTTAPPTDTMSESKDDPDQQRAAIMAALCKACIMAVVRTRTLEHARAAAHALIAGGITVVEIPLTVPGATALICELVEAYDKHLEILIGAGTVLTPDDARATLEAGARFLVAPVAPPTLADQAHAGGVPAILGALTPTEIVTALGLGADLVKIFPVGVIGGPAYIRAILGPFPDVPLLASAGGRMADLPAYRALGVKVVSFGEALLPPELVAKGDWKAITGLAKEAVKMLAEH